MNTLSNLYSLRTLVTIFLIVVQQFVFASNHFSGCDTSIYIKLNGNKGEGYPEFKGVRNLRPVLKGVLYRSGANNVYAPFISRSNNYPLSFQTLLNLYENGFRRAYYLYNSNFQKAGWEEMLPALHSINMDYVSLVPQNDSLANIILKDIYQSVTGKTSGAILIHCWNGWHMSGLVSAYALMQFCDYKPMDAWEYWKSCTDNNYKGFDKIKSRILNFKANENLKITNDEKAQICPCGNQQ